MDRSRFIEWATEELFSWTTPGSAENARDWPAITAEETALSVSIVEQGAAFEPTFEAAIAPADDAPLATDPLGVIFDFNGDGTSDILFERTIAGDRPGAIWLMQNAQRGDNAIVGLWQANFELEFVVDFNADKRADISFSTQAAPQWLYVWQMNGLTVQAVNSIFIPEGVNAIEAIGDFNANGFADFITTAGQNVVAIQSMGANYTTTSRTLYAADLARWTPFNTGNFDGDADDDVFWVDTGVLGTSWITQAGSLGVWTMQAGAPVSQEIFAVRPAGSFPIAGGDLNGDGRDDILWLNVSGSTANPQFTIGVWLMNGTTQIGSSILGVVDQNWTFAGIGDFNGDGRDDILFQQDEGGDRMAAWLTQAGGLTAVAQLVTNDPFPGGNNGWDGFG